MAFKKKTKSTYSKKGQTSIAKLGKEISKIKRMVDPDPHYVDNSLSNGVNNSGLYGTIISGVAQGVTDQQRIGDSVKSKHLQFRYTVKQNANATATVLAFAIVIDKKPSGSVMNWNSVFASSDVNSMVTKANQDRFKILKRVNVSLSSNGGQVKTGKIFIPLKGMLQKFRTTLANDPSENSINVVAVSDDGTNIPLFIWNSRYSFYP